MTKFPLPPNATLDGDERVRFVGYWPGSPNSHVEVRRMDAPNIRFIVRVERVEVDE